MSAVTIVRGFLAFPVSPGLRKTLSLAMDELKQAGGDIKWVEADNIHLTLKFLGGIQDSDIEKISAVLKRRCARWQAVTCRFDGLGAFPDLRHPKVLWAGLDDPAGKLRAMAQELEHDLGPLGIAKSGRVFEPHITLGRVRSHAGWDKVAGKLPHAAFKGETRQRFEKLTLYKSTLTAQGPVHEPLSEFSLAG